jgi:hypothetical protein
MTIWNILLPFVICIALWYTYCVAIWSIISRFGMLYQEKSGNSGTDQGERISQNVAQPIFVKINT